MLIVLLGGSPSLTSRSNILLDHAKQELQQRGIEAISYQVRDFNAEELLFADFNSSAIQLLIEQISRADGVIVATPVYKASFSGALKTILDMLPERALSNKVVLPMATGGSSAHMLVVDYALKPVLAALKAQEILHAVFAEDSLISYREQDIPAQLAPSLKQRLDDALQDFQQALARRAA